MSADKLDKLYNNYNVLTAAVDKSKHEREYKEILEAAHGSEKEKKLAAQFIPKFHKSFASLIETSIDRALDLCEDDDVTIRRMAIKELPSFCKDAKENTPRISDILAQLLNASDSSEVNQVQASLSVLSKFDPIGTVTGLFCQIAQGDESTRLKCLQYINSKFVKGGSEIFNKESEELIISEIKKLLEDVSAEEFQQCVQILSNTKLGKTITGHQELVKLCIEQADLETEIESDAALDEIIEIFLTCATEALPFCSSQIETTPFVKFAIEKFFPLSTWNYIVGAVDADPNQTKLRLLKVFAELCSYCGALEKAKEKIESIYKILLQYLPQPNLNDLETIPTILFSNVECLLYSLHTLGRQCPDFLAFKEDELKLKDFRDRLQYLARANQAFLKNLQEVKTNDVKTIGLSTTTNIQTLIRELYHPAYKAIIKLSWVTPKPKTFIKITTAEPEKPVTAPKRHVPITFPTDDSKPAKQPRQNFQSRGGQQRKKFGRGGGGGGNRNRFGTQTSGGGGGGGRGGFNRNNRRRR